MNWSKLVRVVMLEIFLMGSVLVLSAAAQVLHDTEPGSVLVFPVYETTGGRTTQIRITDTNDGPEFTNSVYVKLNFVCPGIKPFGPCQELDIKISLTYHSTFVFDIPSFVRPPCDEGYLVAYAVSRTNDRPISYNHLIGSYHLDSTAPVAEGEDPIERVFLEDVARRGLGRFVGLAQAGRLVALCHVGVNAVPSGRDCGTFARDVARRLKGR